MLRDFLINMLFPPVCVACRRRIAKGVICSDCFAAIPLRPGFICGECHEFLLPESGARERGTVKNRPPESPCHPDFPYVLGAAVDYENKVIQALIHCLKFRSLQGASEPLAQLILQFLGKQLEPPALCLGNFTVVPIPLSLKRLRTRGYNQAELIAQSIAIGLGDLPVETNALVRTKHAKPQSDIFNIEQRKANIRGAYTVRDPAAIQGKNILLIDDVSTTGATLLEAARALKTSGAITIIALSAAKT